MSSSDRLNPQQLRMFIPAGELMDPKQYSVHSFEHLEGESTKDVQARKLEESKQPYATDTGELPHGGGIWNSLSSGAQIEKPIRLVGQADLKEQEGEGIIHMREGANPQALVRDGMHRIAAAADVDPKMEVPVQWDRNVHWEHDRTGRPDDPGFNPSGVQQEELTPWDDPSFQWESDEYGDLQRFDRSRDQETGQVGDWYHVEHMGEKRGFEHTGQTISEGMLEKLNRPHE